MTTHGKKHSSRILLDSGHDKFIWQTNFSKESAFNKWRNDAFEMQLARNGDFFSFKGQVFWKVFCVCLFVSDLLSLLVEEFDNELGRLLLLLQRLLDLLRQLAPVLDGARPIQSPAFHPNDLAGIQRRHPLLFSSTFQYTQKKYLPLRDPLLLLVLLACSNFLLALR